MQNRKSKREHAALLYTKNLGYTKAMIAEKVGVHPNTITKWAREDDWDGAASAMLTTRHEQLKRMYLMLKAQNDAINARDEGKQFPTKAEADVLTQLTKSIANLEADMSVGQTIDVFVKFITYVSKIDGDAAKQIVELQDQYVKSLM